MHRKGAGGGPKSTDTIAMRCLGTQDGRLFQGEKALSDLQHRINQFHHVFIPTTSGKNVLPSRPRPEKAGTLATSSLPPTQGC